MKDDVAATPTGYDRGSGAGRDHRLPDRLRWCPPTLSRLGVGQTALGGAPMTIDGAAFPAQFS